MLKPRSKYIINSKKQLAALASAARQEIIDVLAQMGTVSIAELAAVLGRPADALYYHIKILKQAGLLLETGFRTSGNRREALYSAVGRDLRIDYESSRIGSVKALTAVVSSMLRLGTRDFRSAIHDESVVVSGSQRELWAARKTGWLTKAELAGVMDSIESLGESVARPSGNGQLYGVTILFTPLNRRRAKKTSGAKPRRGGK